MTLRNYKSYFDYEFDLGRNAVSRSLDDFGISISGKKILDVGCGEGGVLAGLAENHTFSALGLDYDEEMIRNARPIDGITFQHADFFDYDFNTEYDVIILRDVLEHCGDPALFLKKVSTILNDSSFVYVTYTPYLSPFGGHQHNGSGFFSNVPFIHLLPQSLFLNLITPQGNIYKSEAKLMKDLEQIRSTFLTTGKVRSICHEEMLKIDVARAFLVRPDYKYKFGLKTVPIPSFVPIGTPTDIFSTCVEMVLSPA